MFDIQDYTSASDGSPAKANEKEQTRKPQHSPIILIIGNHNTTQDSQPTTLIVQYICFSTKVTFDRVTICEIWCAESPLQNCCYKQHVSGLLFRTNHLVRIILLKKKLFKKIG